MIGWKCKRCGNKKSHGCGMPDQTVLVQYDDGSSERVRTACPLEPIGTTKLYWKIKFSMGR